MALEIVAGAPGGGKSYMAVDKYVKHALKNKRLVVTNLPISLPAVLAQYGEDACDLIKVVDFNTASFSYAKILEIQKTGDPEQVDALDSYWTWRGPDGLGAQFIIDEAADIFGKGMISEDVAKFFRYHRHGGYDVVMLTQAINYIDTPIRKSAEVAYHVSNLTKAGLKRASVVRVELMQGQEVRTSQTRTSFPYKSDVFELYQSRTILGENIKDGSRVGQVKLWKHPLIWLAACSVPLFIFAVWFGLGAVSSFASQLNGEDRVSSTGSQPLGSSPFPTSSSASGDTSVPPPPRRDIYSLSGYNDESLYIRYPSGKIHQVRSIFEHQRGRCGVRFPGGSFYECGAELPPPTSSSPAGSGPQAQGEGSLEAGFARTRLPPPAPLDTQPSADEPVVE